MTKRQHIRCHINSFVAIAMLAGMGVLTTAGQPLHAQSGIVGPVDPNVSVDLSVLEDGGIGAVRSIQSGFSFSNNASSSVGTLILTQRPPVSRLHIKPQGMNPSGNRMASGAAPKLRRPEIAAPKMRKPIAAPKLPPIAAPIISKPAIKAPPVVAIAPPPPPTPKSVPVAKPMAIPAPIAAPARAPANLNPIEAAPPPPPPTAAKAKAIPKPEPTLEAQLAPKPKQTASIAPKGGDIKTGKAIRVVFNPGVSRLPQEAKKDLQEVANKLKDAVTLRLQLQAYAGSASLSSSKARRVSLSRALSVRSFLIESGVRSTRIDVRALGNKSTEQPINRVDVNVVER
jgi:outer membrane protein OmpA-like peptidoglycan-associated protein